MENSGQQGFHQTRVKFALPVFHQNEMSQHYTFGFFVEDNVI